MSDFVEVKFKGERKNWYANPQQFPFRPGDFVIVEAEKGEDLGRVSQVELPARVQVPPNDGLKKALRKANESDLIRCQNNKVAEEKALELCRQKVAQHGLVMKVTDCEYQLDGNKITFYFTADKRVDFRELVKDLAAVYHTRIELRQIGVRDEAKRMSGYGVCGLKLCCSSWIQDFAPITTQAAKEQNLPLNPNKLAGVCGRLKCCLMYERDFYNLAIAQFPELAKPIMTEKGEALITKIDIFHDTITVKYSSGEVEVLALAVAQEMVYKCQNNCGHAQGNLEELGNAETH
ncbi:MAG: regulatory iron-sulfur-containing complex subunit RicT [candidate division KSB1 bacterium]|nr:regulatory iron-sulfur-containing complex subunit RicT [candidate division KSB1 bacterium]MDZ7303432.1 regulatory iron-sulfur-containing complex subunit RicT [candidate division KSB1 bacterium]MDZ7312514.1 regulatory iron-sulfur-containing complex subunit RicT [candidate division KSB1 bacterium]